MNSTIDLSVCVITYNHKKYISTCIESLINQETNFKYEIVIGDDCSNDGTTEICQDYQKKYPTLIRLLPSKKNIGMVKNFKRTLLACKGNYIAICEGDDYWSNKLKISNQLTHLRENPHLSASFHQASLVDEANEIIQEKYYIPRKNRYNQYECLTELGSSYATCSLMFKSDTLKLMPEWTDKILCDSTLELLITENGDIGYIDENWSNYRIHSEGVWQGSSKSHNTQTLLYRYFILLKNRSFRAKFKDKLTELIEYLLKTINDELSLVEKSNYAKTFLIYGSKTFLYRSKFVLAHILFHKLYKSLKKYK